MAYSSHLVNTMQEIIPLWASFAASCGWTVDSSVPASPTVVHPGVAGAAPLRLTYNVATNSRRLVVAPTEVGVTCTAVINAPVLNPTLTTGGQTILNPTRVHFIGSTTGTPFIATVVEFGYNLYRHLYVGYMDKSSNYGGGEIISGTFGPANGVFANNAQTGWDHQMGFKALFNACGSANGGNDRGGVRVIHAKVPIPWREFRAVSPTSGSTIDQFATGSRNITVIGGYFDGPNTGYAIAGKSEFTVAAVVSPISILMTETISGVLYFRNLGQPKGVRHINIENFEPGAQVTVGSRTFIVFPWMSKRASPAVMFPPSGVSAQASRVPSFESSGYLGYAYETT